MRRYRQTMSAAPLRVSPYRTGFVAATGGATPMGQLLRARGLKRGARRAVKRIAKRWNTTQGQVFTQLLDLERRTGLPLTQVVDLADRRPVVSRGEYNAALSRFGPAVAYVLRQPGQGIAASIGTR